jgi:predicted metal-binding protein
VNKSAVISPTQLRFDETFADACKQNLCGRYGRNYTCPPHVGDIRELIAKVKSYTHAVIYQSIHRLEDSFDFEGMSAAQKLHNKLTLDIAKQAPPGALILGAGGCFLCKQCAAETHKPCRHPTRAISSLEAHGVDVSSVQQACELKYVNGINTVTYFSGLFY